MFPPIIYSRWELIKGQVKPSGELCPPPPPQDSTYSKPVPPETKTVEEVRDWLSQFPPDARVKPYIGTNLFGIQVRSKDGMPHILGFKPTGRVSHMYDETPLYD